jgi:hypothetical protein
MAVAKTLTVRNSCLLKDIERMLTS